MISNNKLDSDNIILSVKPNLALLELLFILNHPSTSTTHQIQTNTS